LIDFADERGVQLMCGHTFLYSPPVRAVRELIASGELGSLYFVSSSRVNLGLHQRDVSVIWDLGPHDFSILLHWLKEAPESIAATGRDSIVQGIHDVAFMSLRFPSGVVANVELSWLAPSKLRRTAIVGSDKMVVYEDGTPEPVRVFDRGVVYKDPKTFGEYQLSYRSGDILSPRISATEPLVAELAEFVRLIRVEEDSEDLELARQVVVLAEAAECSLAEGGAPAPVSSYVALLA
jgi:predicted dehydrogenase